MSDLGIDYTVGTGPQFLGVGSQIATGGGLTSSQTGSNISGDGTEGSPLAGFIPVVTQLPEPGDVTLPTDPNQGVLVWLLGTGLQFFSINTGWVAV